MPVVRVEVKSIGDLRGALAKLIREQVAADRAAFETKVTLEVAKRVEARAVQLTDKAGAVVDGLYKASWRTTAVRGGHEVRNDAPYAAVLELGRRPGMPGPPLDPIIEWVRKKGIVRGTLTKRGTARSRLSQATRDEVLAAAKSIRWAIHVKGTKPRFIMRDAQLVIPKALRAAVRMHLPARPR